jgi:ribosomal protein S18 acetylase RimI-like enzyme
MRIRTLDDELELHRIETPEEATAFDARMAEAYQTVFSGEPYFEAFSRDEAEAVWRKLTRTPDNITLVATTTEGVIAGFSAAVPLVARPDVMRQLAGLVPAQATYYLAELGVLPRWRGRQLGQTLISERLRLMDDRRFTHVVLRIAEGQHRSFEMYRALEFTDMGVSMPVTTRRIDGSSRTDTRYFMSRVLSQVRLP